VTVEAGRNLLHFRLIEKIGEGGMGVVWKAVDTALDREVAIKLLPDVFRGDPDRLLRLEREARLLASLNHPNIAAVYGLHEVEDQRECETCPREGSAGPRTGPRTRVVRDKGATRALSTKLSVSSPW